MAPLKDSTIMDLEKLLSQSRGLQSRFEPIWSLNMAFYIGEQWVFFNRGRLDRPRLEPWRVTLVDNRIIGIVRTEIAKMTKTKPTWQVIPVTADDADLQASLTGEQILEFLWRHLSMRNKLIDVLNWSRICGAGFWKVMWDSGKGKSVNVVCDPDGQPVLDHMSQAPMKAEQFGEQIPEGLSSKMICTGDVAIETVSPFELYPDPIATELEDCEWIIQQSVKSPEYVRVHFNQDVEPDTNVASGPVESRLFPSYQLGGTSGYMGVKLNEYWCKPNSQHPNGRRVVWARGKVLVQEDNPYQGLPYVMFKGIPVPGRFWPTCIVEHLRGPQTELNKIRSQIVENAQRIGNPALLAARQAGVQYSGVPGERIDFDDTVPNAIPSYLQPPEMPQYVREQQDRIQQSIQEISGQHEVSGAQVPAGVTAASAINLLQEADDTRLGPAVYDMEETLGKAGSMLLRLVAQYWSDERTVMIAGDDHRWDTMVFRGAALKENTHVEVQAGSAFPRSKAARQAAIQDMLNLAMQYSQQPLNPRMLSKVLRDLEAGGLEKLFGDIEPNESQVNRENGRLVQGQQLAINSYDDHQAHIEGHTEMQKSASYEPLDPQIKQQVEMHIALHRQELLQTLAPPQQLQLPIGQNGGPPGPPEGAPAPAGPAQPPVGAPQ